ncbi:MAG: FHA domain-containing protein, partial [Myxococcota bacterium]
MSDTRMVKLRDSGDRRRGNARTRLYSFDGDPIEVPPPPSGEVAFIGSWDKIRSACLAASEPGVAMFAIDDEGIASQALVFAKRDTIQTAIVGRHSEADLVLADDARVSLRHLAVVLHPEQGGELRYHLLDLRTPLGMRDERDEAVGHLASAGPLLVSVGRYAIVVVPMLQARQWPSDPLAAWRALPARTWEPEATAQRRVVPDGYRRDPGITAVQVLGPPQFAQPGMDEADARPVARLNVSSKRGEAEFVIGARALAAGVLLGRYQRCDNADLPVLSDHRISRVHLLLVSIGGTTYGIDTASTNGVWHERSRFRHRAIAFD